MAVYYNEIDQAAAHVLECLIRDGVIANGIVDRRSIVDIEPSDLASFRQCHFFAGGGFWSIALRLAGVPDDFECWTGSCPCQPFSVAGKQKGANDERHLWPAFYRLIAERKPPIVFGEQVAGKSGFEWFAGVRTDLEGAGYACGAADLCAAGAGAPHIRQRLYWVAMAHANSERQPQRAERDSEPQQPRQQASRRDDALRRGGAVADDDRRGRSGRAQEQERGEKRRAVVERFGDCRRIPASSFPEDYGDSAITPCEWFGACAYPNECDDPNACCDRARQEARTYDEWAGGDLGNADSIRSQWSPRERMVSQVREDAERPSRLPDGASFWSDYEWRTGADGKARRVGFGLRSVANGRPSGMVYYGEVGGGNDPETLPLLLTGEVGRVSMLRILGNAIVPQVAAQFIGAVMETIDAR